ncbi:hypothetical protein [Rhodovulum marinum]|uniref:Uncharacterized protein n=1 Tax=Rhodovulum marinum TaxID=320662 RepID=A0A4R2PV55_9RHOB|nr:hypothetical protein [Rhodovulum marinum]TCP39797.1 hypothetical protein EV662_110104 [Rhodovulum marinum]
MTRYWYAKDLARTLGYRGANHAFWRFCIERGLRPLPDKPNAFDYDAVQGKLRDILRGL